MEQLTSTIFSRLGHKQPKTKQFSLASTLPEIHPAQWASVGLGTGMLAAALALHLKEIHQRPHNKSKMLDDDD